MNKTLMLSFLTVLFLLNSIYSQNPDPLSYFPHHLGDYWEYQHYDPNGIPYAYSSSHVVLDSLLPDSNNIVHIGDTSYYTIYHINTNTYEVVYPGPIDSTLLYKLDAQLGDWWFYDYYDSLNFIRARVIDIFSSTIYNVPSFVKVIDYWGISLPDSLWMFRDYVASGFGLIRQDVEGGSPIGDMIIICAILDSIQYGTCVLLDIEDGSFPMITEGFVLHQNNPNPFNQSTKITYELPRAVFVNLSIYNILGEKVATLVNEVQTPGKHTAEWDGRNRYSINLPSGLYIIKLCAGAFTKSVKAILVK